MAKNAELREFLRTRRGRLQPVDVGILAAGPRRVPGLRREEVAMLAGVSLDYYARMEQGRDLHPSDQVLDAIARALRLANVEREHLHNLVRSTVAARQPGDLQLAPLGAGTRLMLQTLEMPALVVDFRGGVHAMNQMGQALMVGLQPVPPAAHSNHARWLFLEPSTRKLLLDWEMIARHTVALLRAAAGRHPRDTALQRLIGELAIASPEFGTWWADHDVDASCRGAKRFKHPVVGELFLHVEALQLQDSERWLYVYTAEPQTRSADALRMLGTWAATLDDEQVTAHPRPTYHRG